MSSIELLIIAVGLSMDALRCNLQRFVNEKNELQECGFNRLFFRRISGFNASFGYLLGTQFKDYITSIDHWIAFGLLSLIGINMIKESKIPAK